MTTIQFTELLEVLSRIENNLVIIAVVLAIIAGSVLVGSVVRR
jgi:choline-glycine betaine transporter